MSKEDAKPAYSIVRREAAERGSPVSDTQAKNSNHSVVVAIDFGTTYRQAYIIIISAGLGHLVVVAVDLNTW